MPTSYLGHNCCLHRVLFPNTHTQWIAFFFRTFEHFCWFCSFGAEILHVLLVALGIWFLMLLYFCLSPVSRQRYNWFLIADFVWSYFCKLTHPLIIYLRLLANVLYACWVVPVCNGFCLPFPSCPFCGFPSLPVPAPPGQCPTDVLTEARVSFSKSQEEGFQHAA